MNTTQLRINGFSVNSAGHIECHRRRESASRYSPANDTRMNALAS